LAPGSNELALRHSDAAGREVIERDLVMLRRYYPLPELF
jgi:hypothetical protein